MAFTTSCALRHGSPCICEQNYESTVRSGSHKSSCKIIQWQGEEEEEEGGGGEVVGMSWILVAHSSALCHPADICYICMAAGDPWIKRLQEYCHISFNNIIILWGKRCFIPDALQSLVCSFHLLSPFLPLVSLCPSSLSSSLFSSQPFFLQAVSLLMLVTCCLG